MDSTDTVFLVEGTTETCLVGLENHVSIVFLFTVVLVEAERSNFVCLLVEECANAFIGDEFGIVARGNGAVRTAPDLPSTGLWMRHAVCGTSAEWASMR